jgi:hypothetical protein
MSRYMHELCDALCRVLDHCAQLDRRRLAGYAQNIDFWVSEIQHRLTLIEGYLERRRKMLLGTNAVYDDDIHRKVGPHHHSVPTIESLTTPHSVDTSTNWDELKTETIELRKQILTSTRRFVMKCLEFELIDLDQLFRIEDRLGVNLRTRKPWVEG